MYLTFQIGLARFSQIAEVLALKKHAPNENSEKSLHRRNLNIQKICARGEVSYVIFYKIQQGSLLLNLQSIGIWYT